MTTIHERKIVVNPFYKHLLRSKYFKQSEVVWFDSWIVQKENVYVYSHYLIFLSIDFFSGSSSLACLGNDEVSITKGRRITQVFVTKS